MHAPERITELIGIAPDRVWRAGDLRPNTIIIEPDNGWVLDSGLPKSSSVELAFEAVLTRLSPYEFRISELSKYNGIVLSCIVYTSSAPALYFDKAAIQRLNKLGADLDIDLYLLPE